MGWIKSKPAKTRGFGWISSFQSSFRNNWWKNWKIWRIQTDFWYIWIPCWTNNYCFDFKNCRLFGNKVNFTLLPFSVTSRSTIRNAVFVNFSSPIVEGVTKDLIFYQCRLENCSFNSIPYVFAMKNNIATFINFTVINCNFFQTILFAFDSSTVHYTDLSVINSTFEISNFVYSVSQIMDCSRLILENTKLIKSVFFEFFASISLSYSFELVDSLIIKTEFFITLYIWLFRKLQF